MATVTINRITTIYSNSSNTLLETMEQAGLTPEYNCRDGHCGACRCKLVSGEVEYVGFAIAYIQADEILPCICKAKTDVEIASAAFKNRKRA